MAPGTDEVTCGDGVTAPGSTHNGVEGAVGHVPPAVAGDCPGTGGAPEDTLVDGAAVDCPATDVGVPVTGVPAPSGAAGAGSGAGEVGTGLGAVPDGAPGAGASAAGVLQAGWGCWAWSTPLGVVFPEVISGGKITAAVEPGVVTELVTVGTAPTGGESPHRGEPGAELVCPAAELVCPTAELVCPTAGRVVCGTLTTGAVSVTVAVAVTVDGPGGTAAEAVLCGAMIICWPGRVLDVAVAPVAAWAEAGFGAGAEAQVGAGAEAQVGAGAEEVWAAGREAAGGAAAG